MTWCRSVASFIDAPDRCLFGTDWPQHSQSQRRRRARGKRADRALYRFLPDAGPPGPCWSTNPARLHGLLIGVSSSSMKPQRLLALQAITMVRPVPRSVATTCLMSAPKDDRCQAARIVHDRAPAMRRVSPASWPAGVHDRSTCALEGEKTLRFHLSSN